MYSKSCRYAIRAVLFLAVYSSEKKKHGVKQIAEFLDVPKHFLAKILQELSRKGLVSSSKGPTGGFYLSKKNSKAHLFDIILCIDGPDVFSQCVLGLPECDNEKPCTMHEEVYKYKQGILEVLQNEQIHEIG